MPSPSAFRPLFEEKASSDYLIRDALFFMRLPLLRIAGVELERVRINLRKEGVYLELGRRDLEERGGRESSDTTRLGETTLVEQDCRTHLCKVNRLATIMLYGFRVDLSPTNNEHPFDLLCRLAVGCPTFAEPGGQVCTFSMLWMARSASSKLLATTTLSGKLHDAKSVPESVKHVEHY